MPALDLLPKIEEGSPRKIRLREFSNLREDISLALQGVLDPRGLINGYRRVQNPVSVEIARLIPDDKKVNFKRLCANPRNFTDPVEVDGVWRDRAYGMQRRELVAIRRTKNLRVTMGRDQWQRCLMMGDVGGSGVGNGQAGALTASSGTTATPAGGGLPTTGQSSGNTGLQGKIIVVGPNNSGTGSQVYGVIVSNTATVITVDQWYAVPVTGAAGTAPNATGNYMILPGAVWAAWVGLSTSVAAAAAGDVLRTADGLFGDGTTGAAATETVSGTGGGSGANLARAYCGQGGGTAPTFGSGTYVLAHTWTYNGSGAITLAKVVMCNSLAAAGSLLFLETLLSAQGTVTASGDTIAVTWTVTL